MYKRILLVRLSAMGDIVFSSPLPASLRQRYPDAHISWLVAQPFADLLQADPMLDEVIQLPTGHWRELRRQGKRMALLREISSFSRDLKARSFDLALDLQGLLKSGIWTRLSGAKRRIGLGSREGSQWFMHQVVDRHGGRPERIASEYLYLAEQLGLPCDDFPMRVSYSEAASTQAAAVIADNLGNEAYGVICPFTTRPQKHWTRERWIELIPKLRSRYGEGVVMLGGPGDRTAAKEISDHSDVVDLVGQTSLQAAAAVIDGAGYLVGVDTGLTHMGIACRKPTVCLFGSTRPYTDTATPEGRVLFHDMPCAPCKRRPTCDGAFTCMTGIQVSEVTDLLDSMITNQDEPG